MVTPIQLEYKEKEMRKDKMKQIEKLVDDLQWEHQRTVSYTHLRAHET